MKIDIGSRIQKMRQKRNMTQDLFAEKVGIGNPQQVSNIERGSSGISLERFIDICNVLDVEADYLLFGRSIKNAEVLMQKYMERMTQEQINYLLELVEVYAKSCGIEKE